MTRPSNISSLVYDYITAHPCSTVGAIAQALDLDAPQVSGTCKRMKRAGLVNFESRSGRYQGRYVVWFRADAQPKQADDDRRYEQFVRLYASGQTHKVMRDDLHCSSLKLYQWIERARAAGIDPSKPVAVEAPVEQPQQPRNVAGRPYATGLRWSIGHLSG
jgi:DNA-binding MarR family transcriptional regulator